MRNAPPFTIHVRVHATGSRRWLAAFAFLALAALPGAARADCTVNGLVVTCAPPGANGFDAGTTNGYRLTVAPAGVVNDSGTFAINLLNNNTALNYGVVNATTLGAAGLFVGTNNAIFNYGGVAASGGSTAGIASQGNSTVTNYGLVAA